MESLPRLSRHHACLVPRLLSRTAPPHPIASHHTLQAFASPERVAELSQRLRGALAGVLPEAATALRASLPDGGSRSALADPIAGNVAEALGQLEDLLAREFPEGTLDPASVLTRDEVAAALRVLG